MIVLGLDTATSQVGCALGDDDGPVASFQLARGRRHAESLAPAIENLCRQSGVALGRVGAVAVDIGPGLFTGLRVGVATAKALAAGLGVPMVGVTSLEILAHPHRRVPGVIASVVDARRGEIFWALYRTSTDGRQRATEPIVSAPEALAVHLLALGEATLAVGDGACRYAEILAAPGRVEIAGPGSAFPSAAVLVELAQPRAGRGECLTAQEVVPLYLRQADVRIGWSQRDQPAAGVPAGGSPLREAG